MNPGALRALLPIAYRLPAMVPALGLPLVGREPSILTYHGVPRTSLATGAYRFDAGVFEQQVRHLARFFEFLTLDRYLDGSVNDGRKAVLLTFDDGFANNARVAVPILRALGVPAVFFVCSRHSDPGKVLWASYLAALHRGFREDSLPFRGERLDMRPAGRDRSMARLRALLLGLEPHPTAMYQAIARELPGIDGLLTEAERLDWTSGMTADEMRELDGDALFDVEAHTVDHPFLSRCVPAEAARQLVENREFIEAACRKTVRALAYPSGDYDARIVALARAHRFSCGFAVAPSLGTDPAFEHPRAGIFQAAPEVAAFKAMWARRRTRSG